MKDRYDVVIIGGGPAGSAAGTVLASRGISALIVDRAAFPRMKVCGDGISPISVDLCRRLGIGDETLLAGRRPERRVLLASPDGVEFVADYPRDPSDPESADFGVVIPRFEFDQLLLDHARAKGCDVLEEAHFEELVYENGKLAGVRIRRQGTEEIIPCRLAVGADGAKSKVARTLGLEEREERAWAAARHVEGVKCDPDILQIHFLKSLKPGYGWIFPYGEGRANVGVYLPEKALAKKGADIAHCYAEFVEGYEPARRQLAGHRPLEKLRGGLLPLAGRRRAAARNGCLLAGDAASLVDPLTGEGISQALESGMLAAEYAEYALSFGAISDGVLAGYEKKLRKRFGPQARAARFIRFLTDRVGWFVDIMFRRCRIDPYVRQEVFGVICGRRPLRALVGLRLWWNIYFGRLWRFKPLGLLTAGEGSEAREKE